MISYMLVLLMLVAVPLSARAADLVCNQTADQVSAVYRSTDGRQLRACFDLKRQQVAVRLPDGALVQLPVAVSGSGARYSNGSRTFWEHQGKGRYLEGDTLLFEGAVTHQPPAKSAAH